MSSQNNPVFFQYCEISMTNGNSEYSWFKFLPCSTDQGMTEKEIQDYLYDEYNCGRQLADDRVVLSNMGLDDGYYWNHDDAAVGVFPRFRDEENIATPPVYSANDPYITLLMKVAPELFN